ncbi:MAG: type II toxin-antitoxin system VapC family toxin [Actinomycetota bacterium]|nr:type II toxin-antitoxin system VapC family toxin [Actinomycetota bacterium]
MTLYLDTSALMKRYLPEPESDPCEAALLADPEWVSARHTEVEIRRNLVRLLDGQALADARSQFDRDWARTHVVELDADTCSVASGLAEATGARTLDALHLGAAMRAGGGQIPLLTYDVRQAQVARALGWMVLAP